MNAPRLPFLDELGWRGLLHQTTADAALPGYLAAPGRVGYCGFDPTRDSITIGNLIPIMLLTHWQRAGHKAIVLMGGGTGMIGDPSGKDAERQLLSPDQVRANVEGQRRVLEKLLDFDPARGAIVNNADWLGKLGFLEVLRDVGKHFSVNAMIQRDSVKRRLEAREQGISYTEFSYALLQAYDFLHLHRTMNCTVQLAGSDQFGNIVSGIDLIHKTLGRDDDGAEAFGITAPLVTKADGKKIGKSEEGAVWLSPDRTSPYAFYQFWINAEDADVGPFLRWYTLRSREELDALLERHADAPHERHAQRLLAQDVTRTIHGPSELARVEAASQALFGGDVRALDAEMMDQVFADVPHSRHARDSLGAQDGVALVDLLPQTTLCGSKREARQFLTTGAISLNGERVDVERRLTAADLLHGRRILLRRGKKQWHATEWL